MPISILLYIANFQLIRHLKNVVVMVGQLVLFLIFNKSPGCS